MFKRIFPDLSINDINYFFPLLNATEFNDSGTTFLLPVELWHILYFARSWTFHKSSPISLVLPLWIWLPADLEIFKLGRHLDPEHVIPCQYPFWCTDTSTVNRAVLRCRQLLLVSHLWNSRGHNDKQSSFDESDN